jgi:hypothetical protein
VFLVHFSIKGIKGINFDAIQIVIFNQINRLNVINHIQNKSVDNNDGINSFGTLVFGHILT